MKTRLLFLSLLCLICFELNAQSSMNHLVRHHRIHRSEQKTLNKIGTMVQSSQSYFKPIRSALTRSVNGKYYPPKVNREYVRFEEDGTSTLNYRMYYELDQWGNVLLEEVRNDYRTVRTYSDRTQGKMQLSKSSARWNGTDWSEVLLEESFSTQVDANGIRTGVTGRNVVESSFDENGYLVNLKEIDDVNYQKRRESKVTAEWKDHFPTSLSITLYGDSISIKNILPKYEVDKFNPYLCFSDEWSDFVFDSDGSDFVLFNADIYWSTDDNEDGVPQIIEGRIVSVFDADKKSYIRTLLASINGSERPFIVETKTYLDDNGSFDYTYTKALENWSYSVVRQFNEHGDVIRNKDSEIDGDYTYTHVDTYERQYNEKGYPTKVICRTEREGNSQEGYIETYGEKIVPDTALEVTVTVAGTLNDVVRTSCAEYSDLIQLKVTGPLNDNDFWFIRSGLSKLQILDLGSANVPYLPNGALQNTQLVSLILPANLKYLEYSALAYSSKLKTVELPAALNYMGEDVFRQCDELGTIVCYMMAPLNLKTDPFREVNKTLCKLKVPMLAIDEYKKSRYWDEFTTIEGIEDLEIPDSVILNGNLQLSDKWFDKFSNLTLGYGANLIVDGENDFSLKSLTLHQGGAQMEEFLFNGAYDGMKYGGQIVPSNLINHCGKMTSEEVKVEYLCRRGIWYFLSFPFDVNRSDITVEKLDITDMAVAEYVLRYYDGANRAIAGTGQSWKDVTETTLKAGCGYIFQASREVRLTLKGAAHGAAQMLVPFMKEVAVSENLSNMSSHQGWNLIGNPYPCYYDMNGMDFKAPITVWNSEKNTYEAYSILDADEYRLSPMQAFFVQVPLGTTQIQFAPEARCGSTSFVRKSSLYSVGIGRRLINLLLSDGVHSDKSRITISSQASSTYDMQEDAAKFMSPVSSITQLYTVDDERIKYAINALPLVAGKSVQVGYYAGQSGEYVLSTERADMEVWLYDALTHTTQELTTAGYHFISEKGNFDHRFRLYMGINPTSIDAESQTICEVLSVESGLLIKGQSRQSVKVYTVAGMIVADTELSGQDAFIPLTQGVYVVKVGASVYKSVVY